METEQIPGAEELEGLTQILGLEFEDDSLLRAALTHRSFAFEKGGLPHNERLEFLGDSVLGLVVTDMIFDWYPDLPEGELAKLRASSVNMQVLAEVSRSLGLGRFLLVGRGEELSGGREKSSILADAFEALLGAVYLQLGLDAARELIDRTLAAHIRDLVDSGTVRDFKTKLQEVTTAEIGTTPEYKITSAGPDHAKRFTAKAFVAGDLKGEGEGRSKKEAEQAAAKVALENMTGDKDAGTS